MRYAVGELALASGLSVDTIRYYQARGLLDPPERAGRRAFYADHHLERLRYIQGMAGRGFSLKAIADLLANGGRAEAVDTDEALRAAIGEEHAEAAYGREEFAKALGVPAALLRSVERTGLAEPQLLEDGRERYSETDLRVARGALKLLDYGIPLTSLLALAVKHDRAVRKTVEGAIDLFDDHIRKTHGGDAHDGEEHGGEAHESEAVAEAFKSLLPVVTGLVAHHFQRVLVNRALKRLKRSGDAGPLKVALKATARSRLRLRWR
jgi:DNA-binding transcriptional MerR regulator